MKSTNNYGGVRIPSENKKIGRPKKKPTTVIAFRVYQEQVEPIKELVKEYLEPFKK